MKYFGGLIFIGTLLGFGFISSIPSHIPINQIQVIGSHNSYKKSLDPHLFKVLKKIDSSIAEELDYSHIPLSDQLNLGLLNLEIDLYSDSIGGRYAKPKGLLWAPNQAIFDSAGIMNKPGFKILHVQDLDFRSNTLSLELCLEELKAWSDSHPNHNPIFVTMNAKDEIIPKPPGFTIPEKFNARVFDQLEEAFRKYLGESYLIMPDQIRGNFPSLESAILHGAWPNLKSVKGKFIFILDENDEKRTAYIEGHPSLKGRLFFADAEPGTPEAAIHIMNDPKKDFLKIQEYVKKGYIIRTRADADTHEARKEDYSTFQAALSSGAQIITTDYYQKSDHFQSNYQVQFPKGGFIRKNPLFFP